jgi:hypothetical protein
MRNLPLRRRLGLLAMAAVPLLLPFHLAAQTGPDRRRKAHCAGAQRLRCSRWTPTRSRRCAVAARSRTTTCGSTASPPATWPSHVATGANTIAGGAFSGMSGLPLVVQNSGANVLIQNAVIVNVKME